MIDTALFAKLLPLFLTGAMHTIELSVIALAGGLVIGFAMNGLRELSSTYFKPVYWFYTGVWRGMPFLVHMFICYFGLASIGLTLDPFEAAALALMLYGGGLFRGNLSRVLAKYPGGAGRSSLRHGAVAETDFFLDSMPTSVACLYSLGSEPDHHPDQGIFARVDYYLP